MGTNKSRAEKIEWMKMAIKVFKGNKDMIRRNFIVKFHSTKNTFNEIWETIIWQKTLDQKTLKI